MVDKKTFQKFQKEFELIFNKLPKTQQNNYVRLKYALRLLPFILDISNNFIMRPISKFLITDLNFVTMIQAIINIDISSKKSQDLDKITSLNIHPVEKELLSLCLKFLQENKEGLLLDEILSLGNTFWNNIEIILKENILPLLAQRPQDLAADNADPLLHLFDLAENAINLLIFFGNGTNSGKLSSSFKSIQRTQLFQELFTKTNISHQNQLVLKGFINEIIENIVLDSKYSSEQKTEILESIKQIILYFKQQKLKNELEFSIVNKQPKLAEKLKFDLNNVNSKLKHKNLKSILFNQQGKPNHCLKYIVSLLISTTTPIALDVIHYNSSISHDTKIDKRNNLSRKIRIFIAAATVFIKHSINRALKFIIALLNKLKSIKTTPSDLITTQAAVIIEPNSQEHIAQSDIVLPASKNQKSTEEALKELYLKFSHIFSRLSTEDKKDYKEINLALSKLPLAFNLLSGKVTGKIIAGVADIIPITKIVSTISKKSSADKKPSHDSGIDRILERAKQDTLSYNEKQIFTLLFEFMLEHKNDQVLASILAISYNFWDTINNIISKIVLPIVLKDIKEEHFIIARNLISIIEEVVVTIGNQDFQKEILALKNNPIISESISQLNIDGRFKNILPSIIDNILNNIVLSDNYTTIQKQQILQAIKQIINYLELEKLHQIAKQFKKSGVKNPENLETRKQELTRILGEHPLKNILFDKNGRPVKSVTDVLSLIIATTAPVGLKALNPEQLPIAELGATKQPIKPMYSTIGTVKTGESSAQKMTYTAARIR